MKVFIAGVMQGSFCDQQIHGQDYRAEIRLLIEQHFPDAEVFDPFAAHQQSLDYDDETARQVFHEHCCLATQSDVLVAFCPEASMGTAVEMWNAYQHGRTVLVISPLVHNWVVRLCSHRVWSTLDEFIESLEAGEVRQLIQSVAVS
jgi:hypothetical protein